MKTAYDSALKLCREIANTPDEVLTVHLYDVRQRALEVLALADLEHGRNQKSNDYALRVADQRLKRAEEAKAKYRALPFWKRWFAAKPVGA